MGISISLALLSQGVPINNYQYLLIFMDLANVNSAKRGRSPVQKHGAVAANLRKCS